jgi:hypothetical protein
MRLTCLGVRPARKCVGIHAHARATQFEALEPIRQGVRRYFGGFAPGIARGLSVRHDHRSQYMSDHFQREIAFLGIERSPAFVRAPEVQWLRGTIHSDSECLFVGHRQVVADGMTKDELITQLVVHSHDHAAIETPVTSAQVAKASMRAA